MEAKAFENEQTYLSHQKNGTVDAFHDSYEQAMKTVKSGLGQDHDLWIDGESHATDEHFTVTSPGNLDLVIGNFAAAGGGDVARAIRAAEDAFDRWRRTDRSERAQIFRHAADLIRDRKFELAAILTVENGKNRTEAMADIDEGIDFLRFYSRELERNHGYEFDTGEPTPGQYCTNRLTPFGVFGVIGPFNFPFAIFTGMTTGALITGNTVVAKPASTTPLIAHEVVQILSTAGVPDGAINLVTGGGNVVGQLLVEHEDVDGIVFTGSRDVGYSIRRTFIDQEKPGPVIAELGGKNPVIVTSTADMEKAVMGVKNGAFGFSGQKCSATSRVYVHVDIFDSFTDRLKSETEALSIRSPETRRAFISPLIDEAALERYLDVCELAREDGTILTGGKTVTSPELPDGRYVEPTIVIDIPHGHELSEDEHFLPFVTIHPIKDLDEGIEKANDSKYGLCAGLFSEDQAEIDRWLDHIESGMCYVNRQQSATTGALVQAQPFGGWKASGTTSKFAGGYWYLQQFLREQSRTIVGNGE